jgi:crotonobetainyl-CoA:carnitine CoA-transferase CaiB-like acyl-CoA transferase
VLDYTVNGRVQMRAGNRLSYASPHGAFKCKPFSDGGMPVDERWIAIGCFSDEQWQALAGAMGSPEWASDGRFATLEGRKENEDELEEHLNAWTADKDAYELMRDLQELGVPAGVVQSAREVLDYDEHIKERGYFRYLDHPETGRAAYDGPPAVLSKTPGELRAPAPLLGEHTDYVCREILGLGDEEVADLLVEGVLA